MTASRKLVILYGIGGLSDIGRHAILAALKQGPKVEHITVLTEHPQLLDEPNWECGCTEPHTNPAKAYPDKVTVVPIDSWKNPQNITSHFVGASAVISCLGHRQPGLQNPELTKRGIIAADGNRQVIKAMQEAKVERAVVISSVGIQEDWPPVEFHWAGKILSFLYWGPCRSAAKDLNNMELAYKEASQDVDYLFVRPVGIGEEQVPVGKWKLQKEKYKDDQLAPDMAKMDVAQYMVEEALEPSRHRGAVVIGAELPPETQTDL